MLIILKFLISLHTDLKTNLKTNLTKVLKTKEKNKGLTTKKSTSMNKRLELLTKSELEAAMSHVQKALDILNFEKSRLTELSNEGEDLTLNLELVKIELFNLICKK